MTELLLTGALLLAAAGAGAAWYFRRARDQAGRQAELLRRHADRLTLQLLAAEQCVGHFATTVIPAAAGAGLEGAGHKGTLTVPPNLDGTPLAERLLTLPGALASAVGEIRAQERAAAARTADQIRQDTERQIAQVRHESLGVARAAVRGFANNVVARAARLGRSVSQGVRRHISDEAYATLVEIDHLTQQMLLTASGYAVLAGDKLSRRWPATSLTDIVRAAMGRIEGYERIKHPELGSVSVEGRAVEAVVHALAVLLDNALRYSPPAANVHVSLEQGHHAFFLIVDDAGLRMDDERLLWASNVMSGEQRDDITRLGAHPQTGLRVASLLAENYGFRVELTAPNIYQGTRAMIVLPKNLLVSPAAAGPVVASASSAPASSVPAARAEAPAAPPVPVIEPAPEPVPAPAAVPAAAAADAVPATATTTAAATPTGQGAQATTPEPPAAAPETSVPTPATTASGLTVRRRTKAPVAARRAAEPAPAAPGRPSIAAAWAEGSRRGRQEESLPAAPAGPDAAHRTPPGPGSGPGTDPSPGSDPAPAAHEEGH